MLGIDPGTHTGWAKHDAVAGRLLEVRALPVHRALREAAELFATHGPSGLLLVFEDARKRRVFDYADADQSRAGAARREGAGAAKRDSTIWGEFCDDLGIPSVARKPGQTKYSAAYFRALTGWTERTNEHGRDAGVLVFGYRLSHAQAEIRTWHQNRSGR